MYIDCYRIACVVLLLLIGLRIFGTLFPAGEIIDPPLPPTNALVVEFLGLGMQQPSQYLGHGFDLTANT
jgi:hypothetical protein